MIIGSLESYCGVLDNEFEEFIATGNLIKFWSWHNNMGMYVQKHRDAEITWVFFD